MKLKLQRWFALTPKGATGLINASIASFVNFICNLLPVIVLMLLLDGILSNNVEEGLITGLSGVSLVLMYIVTFVEYNNLYKVSYSESANLRIDIASTMKNLPLWYFSKHDLTDLSQTVMSDVERIEHAMSHAMAKTIAFVIFLPVLGIMLVIGNWKLGLIILGVNLFSGSLLFLSKKMQIRETTKYFKQLRANSEAFQEAIEMQQEIKSYGLANQLKEKLYKEMEISEKIHFRSELAQAIPMTISNIIATCSIGFVILAGTLLYASGEISILYLAGYVMASVKIKEAFEGIFINIAELFYLDSRVKRIRELKETQTQEGEDKEIKSFDIKLDKVGFGYKDDELVLKDVSFEAKQNSVTALVGLSGCGKTSVLRLVSRLYDCQKGTITIGDEDISKVSTDSLFKNISVVFQDVILFNNTVMENIRIGKITATDDEVRKAAQMAGCDEFVEKLENGYDTKIGENGASLSGGERQRISIARAILKDAPIIILDEIASSLDVENEKKIQDSLNKLIEGKTVIIISHRLKSIENADKIVVLSNGRVEMAGRHNELLEESKTYKLLVENSRLVDEFRY